MVELWTVYAIKNQRISGDLHILINKMYGLGLAIGFDLDTHLKSSKYVGWFVAIFAFDLYSLSIPKAL